MILIEISTIGEMSGLPKVRICIVGAGGIGANLVRSLVPSLSSGGLVRDLGGVDVVVMDSDIVSSSNVAHQGYLPSYVGSPKAGALEDSMSEYDSTGVALTGMVQDLESVDDLEGFDLVIVCVDSSPARMITHSSGGKWLDLRCRGDCFVALDYHLRGSLIGEMTDPDQLPGSCQHEGALESGRIQFGHLSAASHGCQWIIQELLRITGEACFPPLAMTHSMTFGTMEKFNQS